MWVALHSFWGLMGKIHSMPFPASRRRPIPWLVAHSSMLRASDHIGLTSTSVTASPSLALLLPSFTYKGPCGPIGPTYIVQDNLCILRALY